MTPDDIPGLDDWTKQRVDEKLARIRERRGLPPPAAPTLAELIELFTPWPEDEPEVSGRVRQRSGAG